MTSSEALPSSLIANLPAEAQVLGMILAHPRALEEVSRLLPGGVDSFFEPRNKLIYSALTALYAESAPVGTWSVAERLSAEGTLTRAGGGEYVVSLNEAAGEVAHLPFYARAVQLAYARREVIRTAREAIRAAEAEVVVNAGEWLSGIEGRFADLTNALTGAGEALTPESMVTLAHNLIESRKLELPGRSLGIRDLDDLIGGGVRRRELWTLGAEPSFGKSQLALSMLLGFARANNAKSAFIVGEQGAEEVIERLLANTAQRPATHLAPRHLTPIKDLPAFTNAAERLASLGLYVYVPRPFSLANIQRASREAVQRYGCEMVAWDYGQLIDAGTRDIRRDLVEVTRWAKGFCAQYDVTGLLLGQILQNLGRWPRRGDFKESKTFAEDADGCLLLHRPDKVFLQDDLDCGLTKGEVQAGLTLVLLDKLRRGAWGPDKRTFLSFVEPEFRYLQEV